MCYDMYMSVCIYVYMLMYDIRFLDYIFSISAKHMKRALLVMSGTGFFSVIGFLHFHFIFSIQVQYFPRYHNFRRADKDLLCYTLVVNRSVSAMDII